MTDQDSGKVLAEKYRIDSLLSKAEGSSLYRGTHLLIEKPVTIKILSSALLNDEAAVKSFAFEARILSKLSHPNILNVTDYGSDKESGAFIVYEHFAGESLRDTISRHGKFSLKQASRIIREIASILSIAHSNGIIHQNLASQNILLQPQSVKVMNFGTKPFDLNDLEYPLEKIEYLAPEQCLPGGQIDQRTDVYALGVILFEMLTGEVPLSAGNARDLLEKQIKEMPPPIDAFRRDLSREVDDILLKALAKNPEIRYQDINDLADDLERAASLVKDSDEANYFATPQTSVPVSKPESAQNNLWKTAFVVLAGISLLGATFIYLTTGKQTNPSTQMQTDANGSPVQPAPPPTGAMEQTLSNMDSFNPNYGNVNTMTPDAGGYTTPWDRSSNPPPGAPPMTGGYGSDPYPVMPSNSGPTVYMGPGESNKSVFMQDGNEYILVPKNTNTASNANAQPKKNTNTNTAPGANTATKPQTSPPSNSAPPETKPTATPKPKANPNETKPKTEPTKPPSANEKRPASGKTQETN